MNLPTIVTTADITSDKIAVIARFTENLSFQDDDVIKMVANIQMFDPRVEALLESEPAAQSLELATTSDASTDDDADFGLLVFPEGAASVDGLGSRIRNLFTGFRKRVRKIFCQVVSTLKEGEGLNIKKIIQDVLVVLVPGLAASAGLLPIALPIVVSLAALLLKFGVSKVCPV